MRSICLLDKNNPAAGQLPDMELAKNREEVLALSRGPGDCFLFLRQQDIENDFIQKVKENNPGCRYHDDGGGSGRNGASLCLAGIY